MKCPSCGDEMTLKEILVTFYDQDGDLDLAHPDDPDFDIKRVREIKDFEHEDPDHGCYATWKASLEDLRALLAQRD